MKPDTCGTKVDPTAEHNPCTFTCELSCVKLKETHMYALPNQSVEHAALQKNSHLSKLLGPLLKKKFLVDLIQATFT